MRAARAAPRRMPVQRRLLLRFDRPAIVRPEPSLAKLGEVLPVRRPVLEPAGQPSQPGRTVRVRVAARAHSGRGVAAGRPGGKV